MKHKTPPVVHHEHVAHHLQRATKAGRELHQRHRAIVALAREQERKAQEVKQ